MAEENYETRFDNVLSSTNAKTPCAFCVKETSKYTCPRCNLCYCSTACYKSDKHLQCSENFYKECVMEAMSGQKGSDESQRKMLDMLKKLEEQDRDIQEEIEVEDLEERLGELDINSADPEEVWSVLTERERHDFESAVKSGEISNVIDIWVPWWNLGKDDKSRVNIEEVGDEKETTKEASGLPEKVNEKIHCQLPSVKQNIPSLNSLIKTSTPHANVKFGCIDVLFAYAHVMRLYNGCPEDALEQSIENLLQLSPVLSQNAVFDSVESVVHSSLSIVQSSKELCCSKELSYRSLVDVLSLIKGHVSSKGQRINFVECALSHLCRLLNGAKQRLKENSKKQQQTMAVTKTIWLSKKKAEFLLAWVHSNINILHSLALSVQFIHGEVTASHEQHEEQKEKLEKAWGGSKPPKKRLLVTEIQN